MPVFFLAEIEIVDHERYYEYVDRSYPIVRRHGGEYVFRSEHIVPVSGDWKPHRMVLIRFDNRVAIQQCFGSEEYLQIKHLREESTISRAVIIEQDEDAGW